MKKLFKVLGVAALLAPALSYAQINILAQGYDDPVSGLTGEQEITSDGNTASNGGVGWLNGANDSYAEVTFQFTTSGEVYLALQQNLAMATVSGVHLGGKGAVYHMTTSGVNTQCQEDIEAASLANSDGATTAVDGVFDFNNTALRVGHVQPAVITPATPDNDYILSPATCTPTL